MRTLCATDQVIGGRTPRNPETHASTTQSKWQDTAQRGGDKLPQPAPS